MQAAMVRRANRLPRSVVTWWPRCKTRHKPQRSCRPAAQNWSCNIYIDKAACTMINICERWRQE